MEKLKQNIQLTYGEKGEIWLNNLTNLRDTICRKWNLRYIKDVANLSYTYVCFVESIFNEPFILKIGLDLETEIQATLHLQGKGFVKVEKIDNVHHALLLEALHPAKMLSEESISTQVNVFHEVRKALQRPYSAGFPSIQQQFDVLQQEVVEPLRQHVDNAQILLPQIEWEAPVFLHGDLHQQNILFDVTRGWVAIDPKGYIGDRYFEYIPFLFNDVQGSKARLYSKIDKLVEKEKLNREKLLRVFYCRLVVQTIWAQDDAGFLKQNHDILCFLLDELMAERR